MKRPGAPKRTPLKRGRRKRRTVQERDAAAAWAAAIDRRAGGADRMNGVLLTALERRLGAAGVFVGYERHHVVPRQVCRKHGVPEWDPRNGMAVSKRRHERHHSRHEPILLVELPQDALAFALDYGLDHWLDRHYPVAASDVRR